MIGMDEGRQMWLCKFCSFSLRKKNIVRRTTVFRDSTERVSAAGKYYGMSATECDCCRARVHCQMYVVIPSEYPNRGALGRSGQKGGDK